MGVILGIDIGGSSTKIVGLHENGTVIDMLRVKAEVPLTSLYGALGVPADALADAAAYTRVWAAGLPGAFLLSAAGTVVRARGDARTPMWLAVAVAAVNCAGACPLRSYAAVKVRVPSAG